ncbi:MAG: hypothetical protein K5769_11290 [Pseudobutyrivibrio sp.]|nr:hypothetical protein [Pseudobutyrivibrio sp.]
MKTTEKSASYKMTLEFNITLWLGVLLVFIPTWIHMERYFQGAFQGMGLLTVLYGVVRVFYKVYKLKKEVCNSQASEE